MAHLLATGLGADTGVRGLKLRRRATEQGLCMRARGKADVCIAHRLDTASAGLQAQHIQGGAAHPAQSAGHLAAIAVEESLGRGKDGGRH